MFRRIVEKLISIKINKSLGLICMNFPAFYLKNHNPYCVFLKNATHKKEENEQIYAISFLEKSPKCCKKPIILSIYFIFSVKNLYFLIFKMLVILKEFRIFQTIIFHYLRKSIKQIIVRQDFPIQISSNEKI